MFRLSVLIRGVVALLLGVGLLVLQAAVPWLLVYRLGDVTVPIGLISGILAVLYGGLNVALHFMQQRRLTLSAAEVRQYGDTLAAVAPRLIEAITEHRPLREEAQRIEAEFHVPAEVTLRFTIQMLKTYKRERRRLVEYGPQAGSGPDPAP